MMFLILVSSFHQALKLSEVPVYKLKSLVFQLKLEYLETQILIMTLGLDDEPAQGRDQKLNGVTLLEIKARNRENQKRQERKKQAGLHADPVAELRKWGKLGWLNFSVCAFFLFHDIVIYSGFG